MQKQLLRNLAFVAAAAFAASGCGGGGAAGASPTAPAHPSSASSTAPSTALTITLSDFRVAADRTSVPAGHYTFTIDNHGNVAHELLVLHTDLAPSALPIKDGDIDEDDPSVGLSSDGDNIDPGASQTRDVDLTAPGTYLLVCNIPGHFHAGMVQALTVG